MNHYKAVLDRLALIHQDITGIHTYREPPRRLAAGQHPLYYPVLRGITDAPANTTTAHRTYTVLCELLHTPFSVQTLNADNTSKAITELNSAIDAISDLYNDRRRLETIAGVPLKHMLAGLSFANGGIVAGMVGYDGTRYFGTRFTLTIPLTIPINN